MAPEDTSASSQTLCDSPGVYGYLNHVHCNLLRKLTIQTTGKEKKLIIRSLDLKSFETKSEQTAGKIIKCVVP